MRSESCAGPPLPETLRLLAPLAPKLEILNLGGNKLGGTITDDVAAFTNLTELWLDYMDLEGGCVFVCVEAVPTQRVAEKSREQAWGTVRAHGIFTTRNVPCAFPQDSVTKEELQKLLPKCQKIIV